MGEIIIAFVAVVKCHPFFDSIALVLIGTNKRKVLTSIVGSLPTICNCVLILWIWCDLLNCGNLDTMNFKSIIFVGLLLTKWGSIYALDRSLVQSSDLPCDYLDSSNITDGTLLSNKSIIFDGVEFPEDHYAKIDYFISHGIKHITIDPYIRGCLCKLKSCLRFCCPRGAYLDINGSGGGYCRPQNVTWKLEGHILDQYNETKRVTFDQHFGIVHSFPCKQIFLPGEEFQIKHVSL